MRKQIFTASFEYLDEIRDFVGEEARKAGFSVKEVYAIQLAADEACTNIIEHAYDEMDAGELEVCCDVQPDKVKIVLRDKGASFDPSSVEEPDLDADLSDRKVGGLGIYLMRKLMDEVDYESSIEYGNTLTLIKYKAGDG